MANYPTNPVTGDTFIQGNVEYKWNGVAWDVNGTTGFDILADYAKKVGDNTQTFKVADAVNADEAMALGQLTKSRVDALNVDADTVDGVQGALLGVGGAGYSWVDETANRVSGTTYTNTTGKPIMVMVNGNNTDSTTGAIFDITLDGILFNGNASYYNLSIISLIVPNGSTYSIAFGAGIANYLTWAELK